MFLPAARTLCNRSSAVRGKDGWRLHALFPTFPQIHAEGVDLPSLRLAPILARRLVKVLPHRLAVDAFPARNLAHAQALLVQTPDIHPVLQSQHPTASRRQDASSLHRQNWG